MKSRLAFSNAIGFDGRHARKPEQNIGGRSQVVSRDHAIWKAQQDREKRERSKLEEANVLRLQKYIRGHFERRRVHEIWRQEFDVLIARDSANIDDAGYLLQRINKFYKSRIDNDRLNKLGKCLLKLQSEVKTKLMHEVVWHLRMEKFYLHCLYGVPHDQVLLRTLLRLTEVFFDFDRVFMTTDNRLLQHFILSFWASCATHQIFFRVCMDLFSNTLADGAILRSSPLLDPLVKALQNPLKVAKYFLSEPDRDTTDILIDKDARIRVDRDKESNGKELCVLVKQEKWLSSHALASKIVQQFMKSLAVRDSGLPLGDDPLLFNLVIPNVAPAFPFKCFLKSINLWETSGNTDSERRREVYVIMYWLKHYVPTIPSNSPELKYFLDWVQKSTSKFDPRLIPPKRLKNSEDSDDEYSDDEDKAERMQTEEESTRMEFESFKILELLYEILNKCQGLEKFFSDTKASNWTKYATVFCCIFAHLSHRSWEKIDALRSLSYRKEFMKQIFVAASSGTALEDEWISFCWMYLNSTVALHDQEFLSSNSLSRDQLEHLVKILNRYVTAKISTDVGLTEGADNFALKSMVKLLKAVHKRNARMMFLPEEVFISHELSTQLPVESHALSLTDIEEGSIEAGASTLEKRLSRVLTEFPYLLSFHDRVSVIQRLIIVDRHDRYMPYESSSHHVQIRRNYIYEDAFEKLSYENVSDMRSSLRISLVNVVGVAEAGIDGGGLLREFLTEATKAGVDPNRGLFRLDTQNRLYPNPIAREIVPDYPKHYFLIGRLVGKALYEQTLLELPMAAFFLESCISSPVSGAVDYLATLDPDLHKQLLSLRDYTPEQIESLGLDFTMTVQGLGDTTTIDLKPNGSSINVSAANRLEYIQLVAHYKINRETGELCTYFRNGLNSVCPISKLFSWRELQTLISGSDKPIDVDDWSSHTNYTGGYSDTHPSIKLFWEVVRQFDGAALRKLLKFVTSCSRPPLLGFKDLVPNFGIQLVPQTERLPTAATCMNLLKLPEYTSANMLRDKLLYAIDAQAGFELS